MSDFIYSKAAALVLAGMVAVIPWNIHGAESEAVSSPIPNFHVVTKNTDGSPLVMRGGRPGSGGHTWGAQTKLTSDVQDLWEKGVRRIINLQGDDVKVHFQLSEDGVKNVEVSKLMNAAIDAANTFLEPGETRGQIQKEKDTAKAKDIDFDNCDINSVQPVNDLTAQRIETAVREIGTSAVNQAPIYVHCEHGHDRTGLIIALYRVCYQDYKPQDAYDEMIEMGHNPDDHVTESMDIFFWKSMANPQFCQNLRNPGSNPVMRCTPR